jgi:hypothetical protein
VYILVVYALETILRDNKFPSRWNVEADEDPSLDLYVDTNMGILILRRESLSKQVAT